VFADFLSRTIDDPVIKEITLHDFTSSNGNQWFAMTSPRLALQKESLILKRYFFPNQDVHMNRMNQFFTSGRAGWGEK